MNESGNPNKSTKDCRKYFPYYGDPKDTTYTIGDDRLLSYELKDRVNRYIEKKLKTDPLNYKQDIGKSTTFNAMVRKEIGSGKL